MANEKMNCFADTNLIVYTLDPLEPEKRRHAKDFLTWIINHHTLILSAQSLNECYRVVTERRGLMPRNEARRFVYALSDYCTASYDFRVIQTAWKIQDKHGYGWWDCMLLAAASSARCDVFLSEDMKHEERVEGLIILNPFKLDVGFTLSR
jgi:predicted nucleic acid-binding protein